MWCLYLPGIETWNAVALLFDHCLFLLYSVCILCITEISLKKVLYLCQDLRAGLNHSALPTVI